MSGSRWQELRDTLGHTTVRFGDLLEGVRNPRARAVGDWTIGDVCAHVHEVSLLNTWLATGESPPPHLRELYDQARGTSIDGVKDLNATALAVLTERSPEALGPRIGQQVATLLDRTADDNSETPIAWLGGTKVPVKTVLAHMTSELLVHGTDIARAEGRSFPIGSSDARLIFEEFLLELLRSPDAVEFGGTRSEDRRPVRCEFRLRGSRPFVIATGDDGITVETEPSDPVDVHVSADATAMWLVMTNRMRPSSAAMRGRVVVWGRRPWRLRRLTRVLSTP